MREKKVVIIAGPNGAGKTTFAREFLPAEAAVLHFVNADLIAAGLSPFDASAAGIRAGRIMLQEIDAHAAADAALHSRLRSPGARMNDVSPTGVRTATS